MQQMQFSLGQADYRNSGVIISGSSLASRIAGEDDSNVPVQGLLIALEPLCLDHVAFGRSRILLILSSEYVTSHGSFDLLNRIQGISERLKELPNGTVTDFSIGYEVVASFDSNGGKHQS